MHNIYKHVLLWGTLALTLCTFWVGCGGGAGSDESEGKLFKIRMQTDWYAQAEHGGFYQALVNGYYEEEGLDVEIMQGGPNTTQIENVALGVLNFSIGRSDEVLLQANREVPIVIVGAFMQKDPQAIMAHKSSGITEFADLDGKAIMAIPGSNWIELLKRKFSVDFGVVPLDYGMDRFLTDKNFIQQIFLTNEPYYVMKEGADPVVLPLYETGFAPYRVWYARKDFVLRNPEVVRAFSRATIRGWQSYMTGDRTKANAMIESQNPRMEDEFMNYSHSQMLKYQLIDGYDGDWDTVGEVDPARIQEQIDQLTSIGVIDEGLSVDTVFISSAVPEVLKKNKPVTEEAAGEDSLIVQSLVGGNEERSIIEYETLINHPDIKIFNDYLEDSETKLELTGLYLKDFLDFIGQDPESVVTLANCTDLYQANYDPDILEACKPYIVLEVEGIPTHQWAANRGNPEWGPYVILVEDDSSLIDKPNKKPWGVNELIITDLDSGLWPDAMLALNEQSEIIEYGRALYEGSCINCHAINDPLGGTLSNRNIQIIAVHAKFNRPYFEDALIRAKELLPTAEKMPIYSHYTDKEKEALVAYLSQISQ